MGNCPAKMRPSAASFFVQIDPIAYWPGSPSKDAVSANAKEGAEVEEMAVEATPDPPSHIRTKVEERAPPELASLSHSSLSESEQEASLPTPGTTKETVQETQGQTEQKAHDQTVPDNVDQTVSENVDQTVHA